LIGKGGGMYKLLAIATILIIGITAFSGCLTQGQGILVIYITDAPGDLNISEALITITHIEVHFTADGSADNNSSAGWKNITKEIMTFDLIKLQNIKEFLGREVLEQGRYNQIRLFVDSAYVTINGIEYTLKIPSGVIKVVNNFEIKRRYTTSLTLDFDIQKSIISLGQNKYILQPTIKVIKE
jgi:hypothetical protein